MNPFLYRSFQSDMLEAVQDFLENSNFKIKSINESSIVLFNGKLNINFYLDGANMVSSINYINCVEKSIFELFVENNIVDKYPFDLENNYTYEEWNKLHVKKILMTLNSSVLSSVLGDMQ